MKKIIFATMGLAMFASPLAAEDPHAGIAQFERHKYGLDPSAPAVQVPVSSPARFFVSPVGSQSFGVAPPRTSADFRSSTSDPWQNQALRDRYGRISR